METNEYDELLPVGTVTLRIKSGGMGSLKLLDTAGMLQTQLAWDAQEWENINDLPVVSIAPGADTVELVYSVNGVEVAQDEVLITVPKDQPKPSPVFSLSSGNHQRVNFQGVPLSSPDPAGEGEQDMPPDKGQVDMFMRQPSYTANDVHIPVRGGELALDFRRTLGVWSHTLDEANSTTSALESDLALGPCWNLNIASRITVELDDVAKAARATVRDEVGDQYEFLSINGNVWTPDMTFTFNNAAFGCTLTGDGRGQNLTLTRKHGTQLTYDLAGTRIRADKAFRNYYRLTNVKDLNGNSLSYVYDAANPLLPSLVYERAGDRVRGLRYVYGTGKCPNTPEQPRLQKVIDVLGRETTYEYYTSGDMQGCLKAVNLPAAGQAAGQPVRPRVEFEYARMKVPSAMDNSKLVEYYMPTCIRDARGQETRFSYATDVLPVAAVAGGAIYQAMPCLTKCTTPGGTALFSGSCTATDDDGLQVIGSVQDARTTAITRFVFDGKIQMMVNGDSPIGIYISTVTRTATGTGLGQNGAQVMYTYSASPYGNLTDVTDVSGIHIQYAYGDNSCARYNQPSQRIVDVGGLNLTTEYQYDANYRKLSYHKDAAGNITKYEFDEGGNRTAVNHCDADENILTSETFAYDSTGFMTSSTDPDGRLTKYTPDHWGYLGSRIVDPKNGLALTTSYGNDGVGRVLTSTDPKSGVTQYTYDNLDHLLTETKPAVAAGTPMVRHTYDPNGNEVQTVIDNGANTQAKVRTFDGLNRLLTERIRMQSPEQDSGSDLVTSHTYDGVGNLLSQTDPNGNTTQFQYDALLRKTTTIFPRINDTEYTESYVYGAHSGCGAFTLAGWKPTEVTHPRGDVTLSTYDAAWRPTEVVHHADGGDDEPTTRMEYNNVGSKTKETVLNELGNRTTFFAYDALQRLTNSVVDLNGNGVPDEGDISTSQTYDGAGHVLTSTDPLGRVTQNIYDQAGRLTSVTQPQVYVYDTSANIDRLYTPVSSTTYDANGNVFETVDPRGTHVTKDYDALNRPVKTTVQLDGGPNAVTQIGYDLAGNAVSVTDAKSNETDTTYDRAFRAVTFTGPDVFDAQAGNKKTRPVTKKAYDSNGNVISVTDPRGVIVASIYDVLNRVTTVTTALGTANAIVTRKAYDANGNVTALTLENGAEQQQTTYTFDGYNRQITETLPANGGTTTTTYLRDGAVNTVTDSKLQVRASSYDPAGRQTLLALMTASGATNETRNFVYDLAGHITQVTDLNGTTDYVLDEHYRVTSETRTNNGQTPYTVTSAYDAAGNRTRCIYPDTGRTLVSAYDRRNLLTQVADGNQTTTKYSYDLNGNRLTEQLPNDATTSNTFDALNRVTTMHTTSGTATVYSVDYSYDLAGNRCTAAETAAQQPSRSVSYAYDSQYRLTMEAVSISNEAASSRQYTYDAAGNRLTMAAVDGGSSYNVIYAYNALNQLLKATSNSVETSYGYDLNGNRSCKTNGSDVTFYTYDTVNRLIFVTNNNIAVFAASYDYRTRRLQTTENGTNTLFRYDGGDSFQELTATGSLKVEFIRGSGMGGGIGSILYSLRGVTNEFFSYNAVGHTVALTLNDGTVEKTDLYEAFGNVASTAGAAENNRLANTKERSFSIGLDNHGLRYYDPDVGRYLTPDPIGYGDGLNVYLYVHDNPINHIDPLGLASDDISDAGVKPTRTGHHEVPVKTWDDNHFSADVEKELDKARIPTPEGFRHDNSAHPEYTKRVNKEIQTYLKERNIDPSKLAGDEARSFAEEIISRVRNTSDAYIHGFNEQVRSGVSSRQLQVWGKELRRAELEASKLGRVLDAGMSTAKWIGKTGGKVCLVLTIATVAADAAESGPDQAVRNAVKDASFYSVTVEPTGLWFNRTYDQGKAGRLNPASPIGNYINTLRKEGDMGSRDSDRGSR